MNVVTIHDGRKAAILKKKTVPLDIAALKRPAIKKLMQEMRAIMKSSEGVGLSANQVGLDLKFFIAEVPSEKGKRSKWYSILNPEIVKVSSEANVAEEGCLSIPGMYGPVERKKKITVSGFDVNGRRIKLKAWGFLARVFQHEIDHLNGILISDRAEKLYPIQRAEK